MRVVARYAAVVAAAGVVAGCGAVEGVPQSAPSLAPTTTTAAATPTVEPPPAAAPPAVDRLCAAVERQFPTFRLHGANAGRIVLNATVLEWAVPNGVALPDVFGTGLVDDAMTQVCPQVRAETLEYLRIASISDGLVGG